MKKIRVSLLSRLRHRTAPNSRLRQTLDSLLLLEGLGVRWYNPLWHLKSVKLFAQRLVLTIRRELRGYQKPVAHPNPEAVICAEFVCLRSIDGKCASAHFTEECTQQCFGMKRTEQGKFVPLFQDPDGNPAWLELSCRDCKKYLTECKGIAPNTVNPLKVKGVESQPLPAFAKP